MEMSPTWGEIAPRAQSHSTSPGGRLRVQPPIALRNIEKTHLAHQKIPVIEPVTQILTTSSWNATFFEVPPTETVQLFSGRSLIKIDRMVTLK